MKKFTCTFLFLILSTSLAYGMKDSPEVKVSANDINKATNVVKFDTQPAPSVAYPQRTIINADLPGNKWIHCVKTHTGAHYCEILDQFHNKFAQVANPSNVFKSLEEKSYSDQTLASSKD